MDEARMRADIFGQIGEEGDDVMARLALNLINRLGVGDFGEVVFCRLLQRGHRRLGRDTELRLFL